MRALCAFSFVAVLATSGGCASTVARLDGEFPTPVGPAQDACERADWLVVAPTRAEVVAPGDKIPTTRDDGAGLYRVGSKAPESIPGLSDELGRYSPTFARHKREVRSHDTKRIVAAGLGTAGVIAIGIGTALFISAFGSETVQNPDGSRDEQQRINGGRAAAGAITVGTGLALGIAGIAVNPSHSERSRAQAWRYVFLPPDDPPESVVEIAAEHNQAVRDRCVGDRSR